MTTAQPRRSIFNTLGQRAKDLQKSTMASYSLGANKLGQRARATKEAIGQERERREGQQADARIDSCIKTLTSAKYKVINPPPTPVPRPRPEKTGSQGGRRKRRRTRHRRRTAHKKRTVRRRKHATHKRHRRRVRTRRRRRRR